MTETKYPGREVLMGRKEPKTYVVPFLMAGQAQECWELLVKPISAETLPSIIKAVTLALQWNYPDITEEIVANDLLDMGNLSAAVAAAFNGPVPAGQVTTTLGTVTMVPALPGKFDA